MSGVVLVLWSGVVVGCDGRVWSGVVVGFDFVCCNLGIVFGEEAPGGFDSGSFNEGGCCRLCFGRVLLFGCCCLGVIVWVFLFGYCGRVLLSGVVGREARRAAARRIPRSAEHFVRMPVGCRNITKSGGSSTAMRAGIRAGGVAGRRAGG